MKLVDVEKAKAAIRSVPMCKHDPSEMCRACEWVDPVLDALDALPAHEWSEEAVERGARQLFTNVSNTGWDNLNERDQDTCRDRARSILTAATSEPTDNAADAPRGEKR